MNFNYDGTGDDTFFWAGDAGRPGPQGFIVPNEFGRYVPILMYFLQDSPISTVVKRCKLPGPHTKKPFSADKTNYWATGAIVLEGKILLDVNFACVFLCWIL